MHYDKTYDTLIGTTMEMRLVLDEIEAVDEEIKSIWEDWKRNVGDPKNLTAAEKEYAIELKVYSQATYEKRQELTELLESHISEIDATIPGAIQTESTGKPSVSRVRLDYEHIRYAADT